MRLALTPPRAGDPGDCGCVLGELTRLGCCTAPGDPPRELAGDPPCRNCRPGDEAFVTGRVGVFGSVSFCGVALLVSLCDSLGEACRTRVCLMGSVRVGVLSLTFDVDSFFVVTVASFLPLGRVRVVTLASGSSSAVFLMAAFLAAVAVCLFEVKPAVVRPGVLLPVSRPRRSALVRPEATWVWEEWGQIMETNLCDQVCNGKSFMASLCS